MKRKPVLQGIVLGLVLGTVGLLVFVADWMQPTSADDAYRTTSLSTSTMNFGLGVGNESVVNARINSTSASDEQAKVILHVWHAGTSTYKRTAWADGWREDANTLYAEVGQPTAEFASGARVKAVFYAFDSNGGQTYTCSRTLTLP